MQYLSEGLMLGAQVAPPAMDQYQEFLQFPAFSLVVLGTATLARLLAYWLASKVLARRELATLGKAGLLCICQMGFLILVVLGFMGLLTRAGLLKDSAQAAFVLGGAALLAILVIFIIPMRIYCIGFWRAFALLLFGAVMESAVVYGIEFATGTSLLSANQLATLQKAGGDSGQIWQRFAAGPPRKPALDEIDRMLDDAFDPASPHKTLAEREAAVVALQGKLAARKNALRPGDAEAAANFQQQLDRYLTLLHEVNAERRAASASTPAPR